MKTSLCVILGTIGLGGAGCAPPGGPPPLGDGPLQVVCTTSIIADAARAIGSPHAVVTVLMPAGTDPHSYIPRPDDAERMATAQLVLYNGLHLEGKMADLLEHSSGSRAVAVTRDLPSDVIRHVDAGAPDPHVWFDVSLWSQCVDTVCAAFVEADPAHADDYRANALAYQATLRELEAEIRAELNRVPPERRVVVTSHDAFGYFARAYGYEVRGLQGVSTASATGSRDVADLVEFIAVRRVPAIFTETSALTRGLEKVQESVPNVVLVNGTDALYSDSLGPPGSDGETYPGMVRHNVATLVKYLNR